MQCTSTYIVKKKQDPESLILNRTQVIICSHSLLGLHRHGTCCSRFQRPDAGPRNTIDVVTLPQNHIISFWSRYVTSQRSGVLQRSLRGGASGSRTSPVSKVCSEKFKLLGVLEMPVSEQSHTSSK